MIPSEADSRKLSPVEYATYGAFKLGLIVLCVVAPSVALACSAVAISLEISRRTTEANLAWAACMAAMFILIVAYKLQRRIRLS
jgi:hypothetical protein